MCMYMYLWACMFTLHVHVVRYVMYLYRTCMMNVYHTYMLFQI